MPVWNGDQLGQTKIQTMMEPPLKLDHIQIEGNLVELREGFTCLCSNVSSDGNSEPSGKYQLQSLSVRAD